MRKINWYLRRDLATVVEEDPITIMLNFVPKGKGNENNPFYLQERENHCVVCGTSEELTKHHCVPSCFRKYFPDEYKTHTSHDVLLLCRKCHNSYEVFGYELKNQIALQYNVPIQPTCKDKKYAKYAKTILAHSEKIPQERFDYMTDVIKKHLQKENVSEDDLRELLTKQSTADTYGEMVVRKLDCIEEFEELWRKHFLDTMKPKYLPKHWGKGYHRRSTHA